jgi:hypothetical protein
MAQSARACRRLIGLSGPLRWVPRIASLSVGDLPGPLRQQQILGESQCGRASCRDPCLCRSDRRPPGPTQCRCTPPQLQPRGDNFRSLALCAGAGAQAWGAPFHDWVLPAALERVRRRLAGSDDGDRQIVAILAAVLSDGPPAVEAAGAHAMSEGEPIEIANMDGW